MSITIHFIVFLIIVWLMKSIVDLIDYQKVSKLPKHLSQKSTGMEVDKNTGKSITTYKECN